MINEQVHSAKVVGTGTVYSKRIPVINEKFWTYSESVTIGSLVDKTALQGAAPSVTFATGLTIEGLVASWGTAGDGTIGMTLTAGGTAGSEVVSVTGTGTVLDPYIIDVVVEDGVSTETQVKDAVQAFPAANALVAISTTSGASAVAAFATPELIIGGIDAEFTLAGVFSVTGHAFKTGQHVAIATDSGSLPTGLSADMYVIRVTDNTFKLATSLANAVAGTGVVMTDYGTGGATLTFDPGAAVVGTAVLEGSLDGTNYSEIMTPFNVTATGTTLSKNTVQVCVNYIRIKYALTEGIVTSNAWLKYVE
jgi:hypothetical protein